MALFNQPLLANGNADLILLLLFAFVIAQAIFVDLGMNNSTVTVGCNDMMEGDAKLILALFGCLVGRNNLVIYPATNSGNDEEAILEILSITQKYR